MRRLPIALVAIALASVFACGHGEEDAPPAFSEAELQRLESLGYGDWAEEPAEDAAAGVVFWDRERAHSGQNLVTLPVLRHADLVDMAGEVIQSWTRDEDKRWKRASLARNRDLLVVAAEGSRENLSRVVLRLTWDGALRWRRELPVHHHVVERPDGRLAVLTRRQRWLPQLESEVRMIDNGVAVLSPDGKLLEERSIYDMLASRPDLFAFLPIEPGNDDPDADFLHANFFHWMGQPTLARRDSFYALSNVLITLRKQDTIAMFDFEKGTLVWAWGQGELLRPHDATVLANGNILVFDNRTGEGASRIIELDPLAGEIVWEYPRGAALEFYSATRGTVQRFPNGNTLIGESGGGRAFEVTPEGDVVWEYRTPYRNEEGRAAALRIERYPPRWFSEAPDPEEG